MLEAIKSLLINRATQLLARCAAGVLTAVAGYTATQADSAGTTIAAAVIAVLLWATDLWIHSTASGQAVAKAVDQAAAKAEQMQRYFQTVDVIELPGMTPQSIDLSAPADVAPRPSLVRKIPILLLVLLPAMALASVVPGCAADPATRLQQAKSTYLAATLTTSSLVDAHAIKREWVPAIKAADAAAAAALKSAEATPTGGPAFDIALGAFQDAMIELAKARVGKASPATAPTTAPSQLTAH